MKQSLYLSFIVILIFSSCSKHTYHNLLKRDNYSDQTYTQKIDINNYQAYCRVIYRTEDSLEKIVAINTKHPLGNEIHIKDIQYFLIDTIHKQFIQFSSIPIRTIRKKTGNYLDHVHDSYDTTINIYNINMIYCGNIINSNLAYLFNKNQNRFIKYSINSNKLILSTIYYHARKNKNKAVIFCNTFHEGYDTYLKMEKCNLFLIGVDSNKYELKNEFRLDHFIHSWQHQGDGKKNMIIFDYKEKFINENKKEFESLYFKQRGDRFNFIYPLK